MLVGMGNPLGTRNPHGYGFGQNFIPVTGMGFLAGVFVFRGYEFGEVIPSGVLPIAISTRRHGYRLVACKSTYTKKYFCLFFYYIFEFKIQSERFYICVSKIFYKTRPFMLYIFKK
jgi:hypothetical protein